MIDAILSAIDALEIDGPSRFRWYGEALDLPEPVRRLAPPDGLRAALVQGITRRLYADFYTAGGPVPTRPPVPPSADDRFARALYAATDGTGAIENGWIFKGADRGRLMVERLGLRLWADPADVLVDGGRLPAPGERVSVRMPNEAPRLFPGYYMAFSDVGLDPVVPPVLDRFYLNVDARAAADCVGLVTGRLNRALLPFRLKVLADPAHFDRCDTVVLTVQRRQRDEALQHVGALAQDLAPGLRDGTPALVLALAPGIGFAEDAGNGESFGGHRCGLIASGLVDAHEGGYEGPEDRMDLIRQHMARAETTPEAPYLGPRSAGEPRPLRAAIDDPEEVTSCR